VDQEHLAKAGPGKTNERRRVQTVTGADPGKAVLKRPAPITGSFNWSPSATHQNDEVLLVIESALLAAHFTREMDRLWKGADLGITSRLQRKLTHNRQRCGSGIKRA
jgi:hypothetical protein